MIYINIPVADLPASTNFYKNLGFTQNMEFSNESASGMERQDGSFRVMLLTYDFTQQFLPAHKTIADSKSTCAFLNAIELPNKEAVDTVFAKAIAAGWKETKTYDHGFMYGKDFEDLDGYIWELFWMDTTWVPQA